MYIQDFAKELFFTYVYKEAVCINKFIMYSLSETFLLSEPNFGDIFHL